MILKRKQGLAGALVAAMMLIGAGCGLSTHPNQLNAFDGDMYDTMTVAHAALVSLRAQIESSYPKYAPEFNVAAASYDTAIASYSAFRSAPNSDQTVIASEVGNVTVSIVALENAIQADLNVPPDKVAAIRLKARKIRARASANNVNLADILTELEIASQVAQAIPGAAPEATLASVLIATTSQALSAVNAAAGQPIDLSTIGSISPIPVSTDAAMHAH